MIEEPALSPAARRVQDELRARGFTHRVIEHARSTRSAAEAAAAVGCTVSQIAKSIVFRGQSTGQAIMVVVSGANRVAEGKVAALIGEALGKADPAFVREVTGYAIGGVPPLGQAGPMRILIDRDLMAYSTIWAAAGTPNAVFELTPDELVAMTGGHVGDVKV